MGSLALIAAAAIGATIPPVPFEARGHDLIVLKSGEPIKCTLMSDPKAAMVRFQRLGRAGVQSFKRDQVKRISLKQTLPEAHDEVAATIDPRDHLKWHGLALTCLEKRPPLLDRAEADLRKAIKASPTHGPSFAILAKVLMRRHKTQDALKAAERGLELSQGDDEAYLIHGSILLRLGRDARESLARALAIRPSEEAHLAMARAELARGRYAVAEEAVKAADRISPGSSEVQAAMGDIQLARGDLQEAEVAYRKAADVGGFQADSARRGLAAVQFLQGRYDDADETLLSTDQSDPSVSFLQGLNKLARGEAHYAEARKLLQQAAAGGVSRAYLGLGTQMYYDLGSDFAAALDEFEKATTANEGDPYAYYLSAWCQYAMRRYDRAAALAAKAAELNPQAPTLHAASGAAALATGSYAEAVRRYLAGLSHCPDDGVLLAGLGIAQLTGGDAKAARASFRKALSVGFRRADVYVGLGYIEFLNDEYPTAAAFFTTALSAADARDGRTLAYAKEAITKLHKGCREGALVAEFSTPEVVEPFRLRGGAGIPVAPKDGMLLIEGTLKKAIRGRIGMDAPVDGGLLKSYGADIVIDPMSDTAAGIRLESRNGGVEIARVSQLGVVYRMRDGKGAPWGQWQAMAPWPREGRMRLSVEILQSGKGLARVAARAMSTTPGAGEKPVEAVLDFKESLWRERGLVAGAFVDAKQGEPVSARVDNVVLVQRLMEQM